MQNPFLGLGTRGDYMGTILLIVLILLLVGIYRHGLTAPAGVITQAAALVWFF